MWLLSDSYFNYFSLKQRLTVILKTNVNFTNEWEISSCQRLEVQNEKVENVGKVFLPAVKREWKGWTRRERNQAAYHRLCDESTEGRSPQKGVLEIEICNNCAILVLEGGMKIFAFGFPLYMEFLKYTTRFKCNYVYGGLKLLLQRQNCSKSLEYMSKRTSPRVPKKREANYENMQDRWLYLTTC